MKRRILNRIALGLIVATLFACGPSAPNDGDGGTGDGDGGIAPVGALVQIVVSPLNSVIEVDLNTPATQAFTATGHYENGGTADITAQVTWTVINPAAGAMSGPTLNIPAFSAAEAVVSKLGASLDGIDGLAQVTIVAYRKTGPQTDFFFILPYQDGGGNVSKPLDFSTSVPSLDVFFDMDVTGSMGQEIQALKNALTTVVVPGAQAEIPNTQFGVGAFGDFPISPYGNTSCAGSGGQPDQPFKLLQSITDNVAVVSTAVGQLSNGSTPIGCGADLPESNIESLYQIATGAGLSGPGGTNVPPNNLGVGGVGFREGVMPVVVSITDALTHGKGETSACGLSNLNLNYGGNVGGVAHTRAEAKTALDAICARVVGVASIPSGTPVACTGQLDLEDFARSTGARVPPAAWDVGARPAGCAANQCCTNTNGTGRAADADGLCPLVFRVDGASGNGLDSSIVTGLKMLTRFATFDVNTETQGENQSLSGTNTPAGTTTADFIKAITPTGAVVPAAPPVIPPPTFDATSFQAVTPGTTVSFDVVAYNDFVPQTSSAQLFRAVIRVLAGGCTALDQRDVFILVPPIPVAIE